MNTPAITARSILTRAGGFLTRVCSHSLQPYRGCPLGKSLCGVGCYVQHAGHLLKGRPWGSFVDPKVNAAELYRRTSDRERAWARRTRGEFVIFLSSATEPFPPHEARLGVTRSILEAMLVSPPDGLIIQTHSPLVTTALDAIFPLAAACDVRVHISIESDRDRLPGLPPPASSVDDRFAAAARCKAAGIRTVITVSPLLPIQDPEAFFARIGECADAVVLDHFIGGDGSSGGSRTLRTALPGAMARVDPTSVDLAYRDRMGRIAEAYLPGRVGYHIEGFAGRYAGLTGRGVGKIEHV